MGVVVLGRVCTKVVKTVREGVECHLLRATATDLTTGEILNDTHYCPLSAMPLTDMPWVGDAFICKCDADKHFKGVPYPSSPGAMCISAAQGYEHCSVSGSHEDAILFEQETLAVYIMPEQYQNFLDPVFGEGAVWQHHDENAYMFDNQPLPGEQPASQVMELGRTLHEIEERSQDWQGHECSTIRKYEDVAWRLVDYWRCYIYGDMKPQKRLMPIAMPMLSLFLGALAWHGGIRQKI